MNLLAPFLAYFARRRAAYRHAAASRRLDIVNQQEAYRRAKNKAWRFLEGEKRVCINAMLREEIVLMRGAHSDMRGAG
jgi:hypothetical protein